MKKLPLTIIILTERNDNIFIKALASAQIAEEVLIVDNNSQNDWKELRKVHSFSIITKVDCISHFAKVRNEAAACARYDWILFLDSDEELRAEDYSTLEACINDNTVGGWYVSRQDFFLGKALKHGETAHTSLLRLYKKEVGHFTGAVHEICHVTGVTKKADMILHHTPHLSVSTFLSTVDRYAQQHQPTATNKYELLFKMFFFPPAKFVQNFVGRLGFLDGYRGLIYAIMMSLHSFFVRIYTYERTTK